MNKVSLIIDIYTTILRKYVDGYKLQVNFNNKQLLVYMCEEIYDNMEINMNDVIIFNYKEFEKFGK